MNGMLEFPIQTMVHFMHNHQMLQVDNRPQWRTGKLLKNWE
jgi:predicted NAD/FAD-binding protein